MYRVVCIYPEPSGGVHTSSADFFDAEDAASYIVDEMCDRRAISCTVTYEAEDAA